MRIITCNVNGIRAAAKKGFFTWLNAQKADVVCLQEIKAQTEQLTAELYHPAGYHCYYLPAQKKGYSGVAIFSRHLPQSVITQTAWADIDAEGRYLEVVFPQLRIVSVYLQSGSSGEARQAVKFDFMARFLPFLAARREISSIFCGDWNIAHRPIDLKNWRGNQKNSGFLPEERAWMETLLTTTGYVDAFRVVNQASEQYTWWSNRGQAWEKNVGWRIDYQIITADLADKVKQAEIYKTERFSDHAPLIMEYEIEIYPANPT